MAPRSCGQRAYFQRRTQVLGEQGLVRSSGLIDEVFDNAAIKSVMELLKNEAMTKGTPFRTGPLTTGTEVDDVALEWVRESCNSRLYSSNCHRTPGEFRERQYN